jgi:hypothetical protein
MQIYFKRSGGFVGRQLQVTLDTSSLPAAEAEIIEQMLMDANFFEMPSGPAEVSGADRFIYELKVVSEESEHTVLISEEEATTELDSLLRQLTVLARRQPARWPPQDASPAL